MWQLIVAAILAAIAGYSGKKSYKIVKQNEPAWAETAFILIIVFVLSLCISVVFGLWGIISIVTAAY
ncbi:MAG: hypothetical protein ACOZAO_00710 [Patescibacteria group bacterium]